MKKQAKQPLRISIGLFLHCIGTVAFMCVGFEAVYKLVGIKTFIDQVLTVFSMGGIFCYVAMDSIDKAQTWGLIPQRHPKRGR